MNYGNYWKPIQNYERQQNSIPTGTLGIFINILNLSELSSYGSQKDVSKAFPWTMEICGEKSRYWDSAIEMYLYVMEKILDEKSPPFRYGQVANAGLIYYCRLLLRLQKLIANGNL